MPFDVSLEPKDNLNRDAKDHISELIDQLKVTNEIPVVKNNIQWHQQQNKERHDLRVKLPDFKLGDKFKSLLKSTKYLRVSQANCMTRQKVLIKSLN